MPHGPKVKPNVKPNIMYLVWPWPVVVSTLNTTMWFIVLMCNMIWLLQNTKYCFYHPLSTARVDYVLTLYSPFLEINSHYYITCGLESRAVHTQLIVGPCPPIPYILSTNPTLKIKPTTHNCGHRDIISWYAGSMWQRNAGKNIKFENLRFWWV